MVRLIPRETPAVRVTDEGVFEEVVRRAFSHRRKTLRNALRTLLDAAAMETVGVDPGARAGVQSLEAFAALSNVAARKGAQLGPG